MCIVLVALLWLELFVFSALWWPFSSGCFVLSCDVSGCSVLLLGFFEQLITWTGPLDFLYTTILKFYDGTILNVTHYIYIFCNNVIFCNKVYSCHNNFCVLHYNYF